MSWFAAFGRGWCAIFAKVVHEYRRPLPSSAWHDENNCTARFRQAALPNETNMTGTGN
jgi:hypothetical protein